jgi:hypothetical protein
VLDCTEGIISNVYIPVVCIRFHGVAEAWLLIHLWEGSHPLQESSLTTRHRRKTRTDIASNPFT